MDWRDSGQKPLRTIFEKTGLRPAWHSEKTGTDLILIPYVTVIGGMIWGVSAALLEEAVVDTRSGAFVNRDLANLFTTKSCSQ